MNSCGRVSPVERPKRVRSKPKWGINYISNPLCQISWVTLTVSQYMLWNKEILVLLPDNMGLNRDCKKVGGEPEATHPLCIQSIPEPCCLIILSMWKTGIVGTLKV